MLKKVFCYVATFALIFSINGCKKKNNENKQINEVQQSESQKNNIEDVNNSSSIKEEYNLQEYLSQKDKIMLTGKINNNLDIHMELKKTDKNNFDDLGERYYDSNMSMVGGQVVTRYEGTYYYDKYKKNIRIEGQAYSNGYINIFEFNEKNEVSGSFGGFIFQDKILKGMWNDNNVPKYKFYLIKSDVKIDGMDFSLDTSRIGSYSREGSSSENSTTLIIYSVCDDKFKFHISGYSNPNIGNVGGVASYTDNSKKTAEFYDKESNLKITFELNGNTIKVVGNDALRQWAGAHVTMSGIFVK